MQLRSTTRLPGRYREDDVPDLPGTASFVHPTLSYNPNLSPAVFPTLDYPRPANTRSTEVMALSTRPESPESDPEQEAPAKRATVFHGKQHSSDQWLQRRLSSDAESEEVEISETETSKLQEWDISDDNVREPGEYDVWGVMANDGGNDESPRIGLSVYEQAETWSRVTDVLKLIITMELTAIYSFTDAMKKLMLTDEEHNEVIDLCEREVARQAEEEDKIARSQARQLEMLMSGGPAISRDAASASFEDLYNDLEDSPTFMIKKTDIACAQRFLRSVKLNAFADRLWGYEGVAQPPITWNVFGPKINEPSKAIESTLLEDEQHDLQILENAEINRSSGKKRKREAMLRKMKVLLSGAKLVKRRRVEHRPVSSKLPSGLRNSISGDNLEETVALGPPALQPAFSPHKRPAPPPRRRPVKEKKPVTPRVRFVKKSPAQPSTPQTPPKKLYNPLEHTPDSPTARKQMHSWLADQVEPYTPLPPTSEKTSSPMSTPSRAPKFQLTPNEKRSPSLTSPSQVPKIRLTPSQARLAQIDNILGKKIEVVAKFVTPDKGDAVTIAPPMGSPPEILSEKAGSASRNADVERSSGSGNVANDARNAAEPIPKQSGKANKLLVPAANLQSESIAAAPREKKKKVQGQDDSAYRASGQRRPKFKELDELSSKAPAQKRRKIQDAEKGAEQPSLENEDNGKDMTGTALTGAAASQLTATKVSISEASAAKFKGVKHLEQVMSLPVAKTNSSSVATKENARKMEDEKQTIGQKRKRVHDPENDPDF